MVMVVGIGLLFALLVFGLPVALALGMSGALGLYLIGGYQTVVGILAATPLHALSSYEFVAIPMFILMANVIIASGIADDMFNVAKTWVGRTPGGLAHATALTGAAFGAISGSSTAAAATLSATSIPGMIKQGYDPKLAAGVVAISGTLAMLIPPSVAMVLYAILANLSVGKLLIAGIIPGLLVTLTIMLTIAFLVWRDPAAAPAAASYSWMQKIRSLRVAWTFILLFMMVTGVIYIGIATPTEASALGALAAFGLALWRRTPLAAFKRAIIVAVEASCMIAFIIIGAHMFGYYVTMTQATQSLVNFVVGSGMPPWVILVIVLLIYLILGCFMDLIAMLILTVPIVAPLMHQLGYDPIWFAVITIVMAEVGMVTPPLGMNVFVIAKYTRMPVGNVFRGSYPHVIAHLLLVAVLVLFPQLITWLPSTMSN
ncbi:TRAP transporter large permease [Pseudogemmobacter sonorensis]|uniref:TRAP transporter large permease n=1 Tax=Pseudogemmobacter sonorensis TaxID=2989681 RepID=UPI0036B88F12